MQLIQFNEVPNPTELLNPYYFPDCRPVFIYPKNILEVRPLSINPHYTKIITTNRIIIVDEDCITVYNKLTDSEPPKD